MQSGSAEGESLVLHMYLAREVRDGKHLPFLPLASSSHTEVGEKPLTDSKKEREDQAITQWRPRHSEGQIYIRQWSETDNMSQFRVAERNVTDINKTVAYPSVWPSAKPRIRTLKHNPDRAGEIQLSSPIFHTVKQGFLSVGTCKRSL